MLKCSVNKNYLDFSTGEYEQYSCKNPVWEKGKCKFHGKYYVKNKKEFEDDFKRILDKVKSKNKVLECIGYHFPDIELSNLYSEDLDITIYFSDAKFHGKVDFSKTKFKKQISFTNSIFLKEVSFTSSIFEDEVKFTNSSFQGNLNSFQFTKFQKLVDFSDSEMKNGTFISAEFYIANFNNCIFNDNTKFKHVTFKEEILFKQAKFYNVHFSESVFKKNANFNNTKFVNYATFSDIICDGLIKFDGNISNVSFLDMDIKKIKFGNKITWKQNKKKFREKIKLKLDWTRNSDFKIYDERDLEEHLKKNKVGLKREGNPVASVNLESIKNIYRDLRDNFDLALRYETSGEFHVRELELKRKFKETQKDQRIITSNKNFLWKHLSVYWIYNILAQYGQSYHRPIYFASSVILIATCYFILNEIESVSKEQITFSIKDIILKSFTRSVAGIIPFDILDKGIGDSDKVLRIILLPISVTFFISLKRRLERKFRH